MRRRNKTSHEFPGLHSDGWRARKPEGLHLPVSLCENRRATTGFGPERHDAMYCHVNVKTGSRGSGQSAAAKYDYISRAGKYGAASQDELVHLESGCMPSFASSDARLYWRRPTATSGATAGCSVR